MYVKIEVPEEFEVHYLSDRFSALFSRMITEINLNITSDTASDLGHYEIEFFHMLQNAFKLSKVIVIEDKQSIGLNEPKEEKRLRVTDSVFEPDGEIFINHSNTFRHSGR